MVWFKWNVKRSNDRDFTLLLWSGIAESSHKYQAKESVMAYFNFCSDAEQDEENLTYKAWAETRQIWT